MRKRRGYTFLGTIPFDPVFTKAMVQAQTIFEYNTHTGAGEAVRRIWDRLRETMQLGSRHDRDPHSRS